MYDSAGEPAKHSVRGSGECSASGSEFEVGGATSGEDFPRRASRRAPLAAVAENWYYSRLIIMVVFPAYIHGCVLHCRHWRRDRRRWSRGGVHWRWERECGARETGCYYQTASTARWGAPALSSCGRLKQESESPAAREGVWRGYNLFQMSILLLLLLVCSMSVIHIFLF